MSFIFSCIYSQSPPSDIYNITYQKSEIDEKTKKLLRTFLSKFGEEIGLVKAIPIHGMVPAS